jgi:hypothetical protein
VNDLASAVNIACSSVGKGIFNQMEEKIIKRINDNLASIIDEHHKLANDLMQVRNWLKELQETLSDDASTPSEALESLQYIRDKAKKRSKIKDIGKKEKDFCEALMKFVDTKGELLFNFKTIDGGPRTNNSHELFYKQIAKIFLNMNIEAARKTIASERKVRDLITYVMHDEEKWDEEIKELNKILHDLMER